MTKKVLININFDDLMELVNDPRLRRDPDRTAKQWFRSKSLAVQWYSIYDGGPCSKEERDILTKDKEGFYGIFKKNESINNRLLNDVRYYLYIPLLPNETKYSIT